MQRNNSFLLFLSIVLGLLFIGSLLLFYLFGNLGGISLKELNDEYVLKKELTFDSLPENIQKKYINKNNIKLTKIYEQETNIFDDNGNPLTETSNIIDSLNNKISFLERENILLVADKNELAKMVEYEKSKNSTNQKKLLSNNLEKINEAEKQHYKNISELTQKINDLHRENIELSQKLNQKNSSSKDIVISLKKELDKEKRESLKREKEINTMYESKLNSVKNINNSLNNQISELKDRLNSKNTVMVQELSKKDQDILSLENKIHEMMLEKNRLLSKNSQDILKIESENSKKLQEFNEIVKNSSLEKEAIKEKYKEIIKKIEDKYKKIDMEQKKEIDDLIKKLNKEIKLNNSLVEESNNIKETNKINIQKIIKQKALEINRSNDEIKRLKKELEKLKISEKSVKTSLTEKIKETSQKNDKILQLQDKIKELEKGEEDTRVKIDREIKKSEKKHNSNYGILNQKIASLEMKIKYNNIENRDLIANLREKNKKLGIELNKTISNNKNLISSKDSMIASEKSYIEKIAILNEKISLIKNELKLRDKDKEKLGEYIRRITALKKSIKEIETKNRTSKSASKLELLGKVECGDMISGNFKISSTCKEKVDKFLSQYSKSDYFEVIPIIGSGGFASLNKVQRDGTLGISDSEIKRLTRLSNIGLGRDRAKEGGWLIHEKFGDDVKISYTVYSIESKSKRGFVIRVYR